MTDGRPQERVSVASACELLKVLWPDFVRVNGCVFAAFHWEGGSNYSGWDDPKTETESFINHTHVFDEFLNQAKLEFRETASEELDVVENIYDESHADFLAACELGKTMARMWATKLSADFPDERFRVYYTQYDNPIVRFHKVRPGEPEWLSDEALLAATDASFRCAIIYDTEHVENPVIKKGL